MGMRYTGALFADSPRNLRLAVVLYGVASPVFLLALYLLAAPSQRLLATGLVAMFILVGLGMMARGLPAAKGRWVFSFVVVPPVCCAVAAAVTDSRGPAFIAALAAPVAWVAVLCGRRVVYLSWSVGVLSCLVAVTWTSGLRAGALNTLVFGTAFVLVSWVLFAKASRYRAFLHALEDALVRVGTDMRLIEVFLPPTLAAKDNEESWVGRPIDDFVGPQGADAFRAAAQRALETGQTQEVEYTDEAGGRTRWFSARLARSQAEELVVVRRDVTAQREAVRALEQATRDARSASHLKGRFLANMSHEIRTPMNAIIGLSQLALDAGSDLAKVREYLGHIHESSQGLLGVLNDVIDFSKIEAGKVRIESRRFALHELLAKLRRVFELSHERLEIVLDDSLPNWVLGDEARLRQVLTNLVSNAMKFSQDLVTLRAHPGDRGLVFDVIDRGIGLSEDAQRQLFLPFSQADASTTRRFGGSGLGLAISQDLAHLMGGAIVVSSTEGQGSTFTLALPLEAVTPPAAASDDGPEALDAPAGSLAGLRVLVAEDNRVNQLVTRGLLEKVGVQVTVVTDGQEAVELLQRQPSAFDAVLMDVQMPRLDGYEATKAIRGALGLVWLPIIAMTAHALVEDRERSLAAGMVGHLTKPIVPKELYRALAIVRRAAGHALHAAG